MRLTRSVSDDEDESDHPRPWELYRELDYNDRLAQIAALLDYEEGRIDLNDNVYLMTFCPSPKETPDCSFVMQHKYFVSYIQTYLQGCRCGVACVESTQEGMPHYHMWYQTSTNWANEEARIRWIKVLKKIGLVKITKARYVEIDKWYEKGNALHYYKQDLVGQQMFTPWNPITQTSKSPVIDYSDYAYFFGTGSRQTSRQMILKASQVKELEEFYKKSF